MKTPNSQSGKDFMPTDDELLQTFLYNKINNEPIPNYLNILEYDLFGTEKSPLDIWNEFEASYSYGGKDLYFFTTLKKKSPTSTRSIRTIGNGNWEGEDTGKKIFVKDTDQLLGLKKRYRFEKSNTPQDGGWILHEYNLDKSLINNTSANNYVLCRFRRNLKSESQNTQAKLIIGDQSNSHLRKISRTKNCSAQQSKEKTVIPKDREPVIPKQEESFIPKQAKPIISDNKVWVKKYIIYEDAITQSNDDQLNDGGNKRKYEDDIESIYKGKRRKCIGSTLPEEKRFAEPKAFFEYEYNKLFFGENVEQYPKSRVDSGNSKTEVFGRSNQREWSFNKEDDSDIFLTNNIMLN
ncbi:NAC domain-containing protein 76-like [Vicia villosa]|uniref:NAC domain-containing protein 76-like n=1 Tax=Vicia villosa TaxID=3911 RepID=UPI00273C9F2D|nr:NAC domain-containing protein 76-like [Vicia villosa]